MGELERYLDQVCRGIGGPRALRQHVRQELREHLLDAAAEHQAAGLTEDEALARALADFGGPDQLKSELEATHGHRLMAVVIDKAMQWKERTMRAKWLWATWAYLAAVAVIGLDLFYVFFVTQFQVPKLQKLRLDGYLDFDELSDHGVGWMFSFLNSLRSAWDNALWWALAAVTLWGLFEWRVRGENKPLMRLSILGTTGAALTAVVIVAAASMEIPFLLGMPAWGRIAEPFAAQQTADLDAALAAVEQAAAAKDWAAAQDQAARATRACNRLAAAALGLTPRAKGVSGSDARAKLRAAAVSLEEVHAAAAAKDAERVQAALKKFREQYAGLK